MARIDSVANFATAIAVFAAAFCVGWCSAEYTISTALPPGNRTLTRERLRGADWVIPGYVFIYVSGPGESSNDGILMYVNSTVVGHLGVFRRPLSRIPTSFNVVKYINSASFPGNPRIDEIIPTPSTLVRGTGPRGATLADAPPQPSGANPPKRGRDIQPNDIFDPTNVFLLATDVYLANANPNCFSDPLATVAPIDYQRLLTARFGTDKFETVMRVGRGFGSLMISSESTRPIEMIVIPRSGQAHVMWPSFAPTEPMHSAPLTAYKTYVIGSASGPPDPEYKSMVDMAACADESNDGAFQTSRMHTELLLLAANTNPSEHIYLLRLVTARMWMSAFSYAQTALATGYCSLEDMITVRSDLKMITGAVPLLTMGGSRRSGFLLWDGPWGRTDATGRAVRAAVEEAVKYAIEIRNPDRTRAALRASYALSEHPSPETLELAQWTVETMHSEFLHDALRHNVTMAHSAFYAFSQLLSGHGGRPHQKTLGRRTLLIATSMCTDQTAAEGNVDLQEAYTSVRDNRKKFTVVDSYTPCSVAMRADLDDYAHRLFAAISAASNPRMRGYLAGESAAPGGGPAEESRLGEAAAAVLNKWKVGMTGLVEEYAPEVLACGYSSMDSVIMVLPVGINGSYVIGRKNVGNGLVYRADGVSVNNQLFITFMTGTCGSSAFGTVTSSKLPRPSAGECPYCGCVIVKYDASGEVRTAIYVDSENSQNELVAAANSSVRYFNPRVTSTLYSTTLILFPNGTVARLTAFESERRTALSITYIVSAVIGCILAVGLIAITVRMVVGALSEPRGDRDDEYEIGRQNASRRRVGWGETPFSTQKRTKTGGYERLRESDGEGSGTDEEYWTR